MSSNHNRKLAPGIVRGWHLIGAGPARYGYALIRTCDKLWLGKTRAEAIANSTVYPYA